MKTKTIRYRAFEIVIVTNEDGHYWRCQRQDNSLIEQGDEPEQHYEDALAAAKEALDEFLDE